MKINVKLFAVFSLLTAVVVTATTASAVSKCSSGTVVATGVVPTLANPDNKISQYMVQIQCNSETEFVGTKQFLLSSDVAEGGYATALTAISLSRQVYVEMGGYAWNSRMDRISIQPE